MGYWTSGYDIIFLIAYYSLLNKYDTVKKQNKCCVNNCQFTTILYVRQDLLLLLIFIYAQKFK